MNRRFWFPLALHDQTNALLDLHGLRGNGHQRAHGGAEAPNVPHAPPAVCWGLVECEAEEHAQERQKREQKRRCRLEKKGKSAASYRTARIDTRLRIRIA